MARRAKAPAPRLARIKVGGAETGDAVRHGALMYVVFGLRSHRTWVRRVDEQGREISEPLFLDPGLDVELVRLGRDRYEPVRGGDDDPLLKGAA